MRITKKTWQKYIGVLRKLNNKAAEDMIQYQTMLAKQGISPEDGAKLIVDHAYQVATKYGEGAAAAACEMYDAIAILSKASVPSAVPAATATYGETAKTVYGTLKVNPEITPAAVGRLVKMAGADTALKNAIRDGAYWAWIPSGDTCAFCLMLAGNGWQRASRSQLEGNHAEHIHANCDCTFAISFGDVDVEGYDPEEYQQMYDSAEGTGWRQKVNAMRREIYDQNSEEINAQKRDAYEKRKERENSASEELYV